MLQYDFEKSLGYWIFATAHELSRAMNEELAAHDITYRQWVLLACLSLLGREASQSELAERMGIEAPTLVGVIDRMERDGWIQRVPDPSDRRKKLIRPTERVEPVWAKMAQCALQVRGQAAAGLAPEQLDQLRDTLAAIHGNLTGNETDRGATAKSAGEVEGWGARRSGVLVLFRRPPVRSTPQFASLM